MNEGIICRLLRSYGYRAKYVGLKGKITQKPSTQRNSNPLPFGYKACALPLCYYPCPAYCVNLKSAFFILASISSPTWTSPSTWGPSASSWPLSSPPSPPSSPTCSPLVRMTHPFSRLAGESQHLPHHYSVISDRFIYRHCHVCGAMVFDLKLRLLVAWLGQPVVSHLSY